MSGVRTVQNLTPTRMIGRAQLPSVPGREPPSFCQNPPSQSYAAKSKASQRSDYHRFCFRSVAPLRANFARVSRWASLLLGCIKRRSLILIADSRRRRASRNTNCVLSPGASLCRTRMISSQLQGRRAGRKRRENLSPAEAAQGCFSRTRNSCRTQHQKNVCTTSITR